MVKEKIIEIISEEIGNKDFDLDADLANEYEIDSIGLLDFIMTIEDEFNIEFDDEELDSLTSANEIINLVERKI